MATSAEGSEPKSAGAPSPLDGLPPFSDNARRVLDDAIAEAKRRNHSTVASEHVLWALIRPKDGIERPRVLSWIADQCKLTSEKLTEKIERNLRSRPLWATVEVSHEDDTESSHFSTALTTALGFLRQLSSRPVYDPSLDVRFSDGLVSTEFLVAALLLEGTNVAADILQRLSKGAINSRSILSIIKIDPATVFRPRSDDQTWECFQIGEGKWTDIKPWFPDELPKLRQLPKAPSKRSNWLVPSQLLIGAKPGGYSRDGWQDLKAYIDAGITTFVCLIGEYRSIEAYRRRYPAYVTQHNLSANFIWFGIHDFETVDREQLQPFVLELLRRLKEGERLYIHCLGGHGRTGMVVIPLIAALYDLDYQAAERYVGEATAQGRQEDRELGYVYDMPETDEQAQVAESTTTYVRKKTRR